MNPQNFDYLYRKKEKVDVGVSRNVKKVVFLIFALFLILYPNLSPFEANHTTQYAGLGYIFNLYFFIVNQTLGIVHESGHGVCYLLDCPQFITALNGTVFQVGFPLLVAYYYGKKEKKMAMYIALFFVGFSLQYVAWYMSTAQLSLIVPASKSFLGVDGYHDFHYIFNAMGILSQSLLISEVTKFFAYIMMIFSVFKMFLASFEKE